MFTASSKNTLLYAKTDALSVLQLLAAELKGKRKQQGGVVVVETNVRRASVQTFDITKC